MKNLVLELISRFAVQELRTAYNYAGVADAENKCVINSDDGKGNGIIITIAIEQGS